MNIEERVRAALSDRVRTIEVTGEGWIEIERRLDGPVAPARRPRQRLMAGVVAFGMFALAAGFAWHAFRGVSSPGGGSSARSIWPSAIRGSHPPVTKAASEACAARPASGLVSPTTAAAGAVVSVRGPLSYRNEGGRFGWYVKEHPRMDVQAWWGLEKADYASVASQGLAIAAGRPYRPSGSGPQMLGDFVPNGACAFDVRFRVPQLPAGTYPVTVVEVGGNSSTAYGSFTLALTDATSGTISGRLFAVGGPSPGRRPLPGTVFISGSIDFQVTVGADGGFVAVVPDGTYAVTGRSARYENGRALCRAAVKVVVVTGARSRADVVCQER